jgi:hypothetical protein
MIGPPPAKKKREKDGERGALGPNVGDMMFWSAVPVWLAILKHTQPMKIHFSKMSPAGWKNLSSRPLIMTEVARMDESGCYRIMAIHVALSVNITASGRDLILQYSPQL